MDAKIRQMINKTVAEVFETMFFTFLTPLAARPNEEEWGHDRPYIRASIGYSGPLVGEFHFYFPRRLARELTVNFLSTEAVEDRQILDTAAEVANMAVGSLLGKWDSEGECALGIPVSAMLEDFTPAEIVSESGLCVFNTGSGCLWVVYREG